MKLNPAHRPPLHHRSHLPSLVAAFIAAALGPGDAAAQLRIVNYNIAGLNGNQTSMQAVFAALNADDKPGFAVAPHLYVFQEVHTTDTTPLVNLLNAAAPPGVTYALGTYTNFNENGAAGAQAMCYRTDTLAELTADHLDIFTQGGRYTDRWRLRLLGYDSNDARFYIYSTHLKASTGSSNQQDRLTGATAIRNNANALPAGTHIIYSGDFNVYANSEPAYLKFLEAGVAQSFDPLGTGSWAGSGNAIKHTQAPCATNCSPLVAGGMDDRFDFQLSTGAFHDAAGLALISGTYRSFGNDGNHFDTDINAGNNTYYPTNIPRSNTLAGQLKFASDHVPVVADYQMPAVLSATMAADFGRAIQNAEHAATLSIANTAIVVTPLGADTLDYSVSTAGVLSGSPSGSVAALSSSSEVLLPIDTSTVGVVNGSATVSSTNQAVQGSPAVRNITGRVVRLSVASLSDAVTTTAATVSLTVPHESGIHELTAEVTNLGFDADQALLDIDDVAGMNVPFSLADISQTANIGAIPAVLAFDFDTTGLIPGLYTNTIEIAVSDEDIPGESSTVLTLSLEVTIEEVIIPVIGDVDCDGDVDMDDVVALCGVLLDIDGDPCHVAQADIDGSGSPDGLDIQPFLATLLNP